MLTIGETRCDGKTLGAAGESWGARIRRWGSRCLDLVRSPAYRRAVWFRFVCDVIRWTNRDLRFVGLVRDGEATILLLTDRVITPFTLATDGFQREELLKVLVCCDRIGSTRGGWFVDVGANVGTTTMHALGTGRFRGAVCIEPAPGNVQVLRMNIAANSLEDRVRVFAGAASETAGMMPLHLSGNNAGDHRVGVSPARSEIGVIDVAVDRIDAILESLSIAAEDVSCVWIDVQGHEGFALRGADRLLREGVPVSIEFWPAALRSAGGVEGLLEIIERHFEGFVDLHSPVLEFAPVSAIRELADSLGTGNDYTDLFLVPKGKRWS